VSAVNLLPDERRGAVVHFPMNTRGRQQ